MEALRILFLFLLIGTDVFFSIECNARDAGMSSTGSRSSAAKLIFKSRKFPDKIDFGNWRGDNSMHDTDVDYPATPAPIPSSRFDIPVISPLPDSSLPRIQVGPISSGPPNIILPSLPPVPSHYRIVSFP